MKRLIKSTIVMLALSLTTLYASGSHSHDDGHGHSHAQKEVSKSYAQNEATNEINKLVRLNKIDASWSKVPAVNIKKKKFKNNIEWVVNFENKIIKDSKKQMIYVFENLYGEVTGANYSGK